MTTNTAAVGARLGIAGKFEFKDKDGNVLKTMEVTGAVPLESTGMSVEQAQELINQQKGISHDDDRK